MKANRRDFIKKSTSLTIALTVGASAARSKTQKPVQQQKKTKWPLVEGPDTPKLVLNCPSNATPERMRNTKQIGCDYVLMGGPPLPWTESGLRQIMDRFKTEGLTVINMMLPTITNSIYAREGRDEEIKKVQDSLRAAGAAGLPIVEYNFYAHRLTEGYHPVAGRGGAGYLGYDYNRTSPTADKSFWTYPNVRQPNEMTVAPKDLKPLPEIGAYPREKLWDNITYFLKAVIPVAEKAGVRMALHPNDPPAPVSRGSQQIMATFADWKKLVNIVDSPSNGMTYDCGVSNEIGEDPLVVLDYLASRNRINHVHYRNCIVDIPSIKYVEVFPDNGTVDMFAVMQQLVKRKYKFGIFPEHPKVLDFDKQHPGGGDFAGYLYNQAYARAMMQAAMSI